MCIFWTQTLSLPPGYAISDLQNFQKVSNNLKKKFLKGAPCFSLREWKHGDTKVEEEYCWAITAGGAIMLRPIRFHCVGDQVSTGLHFMYFHTRSWPCVAYTQLRLVLDLPERNYCVSRGVSLVVLDTVKRKYFQDVNKKWALFVISGFRRCVKYSLFWDVTQRWLVGKCWRFGTTYLSHFQGSYRSIPERL